MVSMLIISLHTKLHLVFALLALTAGNTAVAVADVTVDACVAQKSISHPSLAADMQSLCALSYSIGGLLGFSISGVFVHLIGPKVFNFLIKFCNFSFFIFQLISIIAKVFYILPWQGVFGLLTLPAALVSLVGFLLYEPKMSNFDYSEVLLSAFLLTLWLI